MLYDLLLRELALEKRSIYNHYSLKDNQLLIYKSIKHNDTKVQIKELVDIKSILKKYTDLFTASFFKESIQIQIVQGIN